MLIYFRDGVGGWVGWGGGVMITMGEGGGVMITIGGTVAF